MATDIKKLAEELVKLTVLEVNELKHRTFYSVFLL